MAGLLAGISCRLAKPGLGGLLYVPNTILYFVRDALPTYKALDGLLRLLEALMRPLRAL